MDLLFVPAGTMQCPVLLGRGGWTRSKTRLDSPLPRASDKAPLFGELELRSDEEGVAAFSRNLTPSTDNARFQLVYGEEEDAFISGAPPPDPPCYSRAEDRHNSAPTGKFLVDIRTTAVRHHCIERVFCFRRPSGSCRLLLPE